MDEFISDFLYSQTSIEIATTDILIMTIPINRDAKKIDQEMTANEEIIHLAIITRLWLNRSATIHIHPIINISNIMKTYDEQIRSHMPNGTIVTLLPN